MASPVPLLKDPKKKKVQETLLQHGIAQKTAQAVASVELRNWSPEQLSTIFRKVTNHGPDRRSFEVDPPGPLSIIANLELREQEELHWLKPPPEIMKDSAQKGLALCVNAAGKWALLSDGYFAISHVWEEGIQADPNNRGMPLSHIQQIIQRIQQTGAEWIWLDGLAIPGANRTLNAAEERLKIAIINNLGNIYQRAKAVIIFDAIVMRLQSNDFLDVAVCLLCGKWMTRVWTYQEITLAKRALVVTGNGFVEFQDMVRRLRAFSGLDKDLPEIFGSSDSPLDQVSEGEKSSDKYKELYLTFGRLLLSDGKRPSLTQLAFSCRNRKTGNDIDYARAFFPVLRLVWHSRLTREEGMELIYNEQKWYAKHLLLMPGSPRSSYRPGWAPSYLTRLEGRPIRLDDPLGDIEWEIRGLKKNWYSYKVREILFVYNFFRTWLPRTTPCKVANVDLKVKAHYPTSTKNALLLELDGGGNDGIICSCGLSVDERVESIEGFRNAITRNSAYILSNEIIISPLEDSRAYNVILVERDEESNVNEAWVYFVVTMITTGKPLSVKPIQWLIFHESPIGTHYQSGKMASKARRLLNNEPALHRGQTHLHIAAESGDESALRGMLACTDQIESRDEKGWTPLHIAAFKGQVIPVRLLLECGAAVDALDNSERSPLMIASDEGHCDVVKELIQRGADVNLSSQNAWCPLNQALLARRIDTVKILLKSGANPNGHDKFGFAPLLVASDDDQLVGLLIAAGADHRSGLFGKTTTLHFAARRGNLPLVERLLALNMPVDLPDGSAVTPLSEAIEGQEEAVVSRLLSLGANPNHVMETTWTCVLQAAKIGNVNILKLLLQHGADKHSFCRPEKWTALHIASSEGHRLAVKLLLDAGWEVNVRDVTGATPLDLAGDAGHTAIVEILRRTEGSTSPSRTICFMVPFEKDLKFTGREDIITEIDRKFEVQRQVALAGISGVG